MSGDRIELTEEDVHAVAVAAWSPLPDHPQDLAACFDTVREVVAAVNRVRAGDPAGTIRRADTGVVALMTGVDPAAPWTAFSPCGNPLGKWTQEQVSLWPVIYTPEEES